MNQHYREAERLSAESSLIHEWPAAERAAQAGRGQIEAILALAYEQARTADALEVANLIAYLNAANLETVAYPVPLEVQKSIQAQIDVRLGLA